MTLVSLTLGPRIVHTRLRTSLQLRRFLRSESCVYRIRSMLTRASRWRCMIAIVPCRACRPSIHVLVTHHTCYVFFFEAGFLSTDCSPPAVFLSINDTICYTLVVPTLEVLSREINPAAGTLPPSYFASR